MKRIMIMMGTRPEAIKLCPLVIELKKRGKYEVLVCSSGQHRTMLDSVLTSFGVKPHFDMQVMSPNQSLSDVTARILKRGGELLGREKPDLLLVHGDTATAFAGALAAFHQRIPIGHVEAGLRTHCITSPFPEEFHRQAISLMANYHFAPTISAKQNLLKEGRPSSSVFVTGNTVVDALRFTLSNGEEDSFWNFPTDKRIVVFTAHRRESFGKPICNMLKALRRIVEDTPDILVYFPVHHNPEIRKKVIEILKGVPRIRLIEPMELIRFHHLLSKAYLIMTDSGGIQEEASALGIPTIVMRYSSERTEGLRAGILKLSGCDEEGIVLLAKKLLAPDSEEYTQMKKPSAVYGDGKAAERIADILETLG